jgi:hypothetical protein
MQKPYAAKYASALLLITLWSVSGAHAQWTTLYNGGMYVTDSPCCASGFEFRQVMSAAPQAFLALRITYNAQHAAVQPTTFVHVSACIQASGSTCAAMPVEQTCSASPYVLGPNTGLVLANKAPDLRCDRTRGLELPLHVCCAPPICARLRPALSPIACRMFGSPVASLRHGECADADARMASKLVFGGFA